MFMASIALAGGANLSSRGLLSAPLTVWMARESNRLLALGPLGRALGKGKDAEKNL